MSKKTRPIGDGVRNITVTLPIPEVLRTERQARISGVDRSPYIRTIVEWANDHGAIVRPESSSYAAYVAALERNQSPLPKIKYELVLTKLPAPLQVMLDPREPSTPVERRIVYLPVAQPEMARVAEDPTHATAPHPASRRVKG